MFDIVSGLICKKNLRTNTNELKVAIDDEQLQLEAHLVLEPRGDAAIEFATYSKVENEDSSEKEELDGEKGDKSYDGKSDKEYQEMSQTKSL